MEKKQKLLGLILGLTLILIGSLTLYNAPTSKTIVGMGSGALVGGGITPVGVDVSPVGITPEFDECSTNSDCEVFFSSCSCSNICVPKDNSVIDCGKLCRDDEIDQTIPQCICEDGACAAIENKLVSYWKFDEATETFLDKPIARDSQGNNDGTINGATWTTGVSNYALSFDGVDDYVDFGDPESLTITNEISISVWAKSDGSSRQTIYARGPALSLEYTPDGLVSFGVRNPEHKLSKVSQWIDQSKWHHIVAVYSDPMMYLYVDGVLVKSKEHPYGGQIRDHTTDKPNTVGNKYAWHDGNDMYFDHYFNGLIDEVRVYKEALSASQVKELYQLVIACEPACTYLESRQDAIDNYCGSGCAGKWKNPITCHGAGEAGEVECRWESFGDDCEQPYCECECIDLPVQPEIPDIYRHHIHNFGTNYNRPKQPDTYAAQHRNALQMGYSIVTNGKPGDARYEGLGVLQDHNARVFPLRLKQVGSTQPTFIYRSFYHTAFDESEGRYRSAFDETRHVMTEYDVDPDLIDFIKLYACARPNADLSRLTADTLTQELMDELFYTGWVKTEANGTTSMTIASNWQNRKIVDELTQITIDTLKYKDVQGFFFDQFGGGPAACSNANLPGGETYEGYREGQKDFVARVTDHVRALENSQGNPYFITVNVGHPFKFSGARAAEFYTDGSFRADMYYFEWGNLRDNEEGSPTYRQIISPMTANGVVPEGESDAGKPAFVYTNDDGSVKWFLPAFRGIVDTEAGWYDMLGIREKAALGVPNREDDYRDDQNCWPLPQEDDYLTQHLRACGMAGSQGSWFGYYGEDNLPDLDDFICENDVPRLKVNQEKERVYTADRQLLRAIPNWDNLLEIPLSQREWDASNLIYQSTNTYASKDVVYSRHFETGELFVVFITLNGEVSLKPEETVKSAYFVNEYFEKTIDDARRCLIINAGNITLKSECSDKLKTGIRISSTIAPYTDGLVAHWSFDESSGDAIDSVSGNNGRLVNGVSRTAGVSGNALQLDGVDDFVFVGDVLDMATSDMSISFWVKTTSDSYSSVVSKAYNVPYHNVVMLGNGKSRVLMHNGDQIIQTTTSSVVNNGEWHHVVAVYDRDDKAHVYVDGVKENSVDISQDAKVVISNPNALAFGTNCKFADIVDNKCKYEFNNHLKGSLDEVRVYNRVLSADEVEELYLIESLKIIIEETDNDWWLPNNVNRDLNRGFHKLLNWGPNPDYRIPIVTADKTLSWSDLNPEEDVYRFDLIEDKLREFEGTPYSFGSWMLCSERRFVPDWIVEKHNPLVLELKGDDKNHQPTYVNPFDENVQAEYRKFLGALKNTIIPNHPNLAFVHIPAFSSEGGETTYLVDEDFATFENNFSMTPEKYEAWVKDRIDAYLDVFAGQEHKLAWISDERAVRRTIGDAYDNASTRIVDYALEKGISFRGGIIEMYYGQPLARPRASGVSLVQDPYGRNELFHHDMYIHTNLDFPPIAEGRVILDENENYRLWNDTEEQQKHRWLMSNVLALAMGINIDMTFNLAYNLNPEFSDYVQRLMGKTVDRSPEAMAFLNEGYSSKYVGDVWSDVTVKNFERFLYQRDLPGAHTVAVEKFYRKRAGGESGMRNPPWEGENYFDYIARRTDLASGNNTIYFNVEDRFIFNEPNLILLKVTYKDNSNAIWHIEYDAGEGGILSTPSVTGGNDGKWKTVTFKINDAMFSNMLPYGQDFAIVTEGDDVTVKYVRIIKLEQSAIPICGDGSCDAGEDYSTCPQDCPEVGPQDWWDEDWKYRRSLTIDRTTITKEGGTGVQVALDNFPLLIELDAPDLMYKAQVDGDDFVFINPVDMTRYDHEIESYDYSKSRLFAWVRVPTMPALGDTLIHAYYGNPSAADQQNPAGVWNSDYRGVWHLSETGTGTRSDSSVNNNPGTPVGYNGDEARSDGKIDGADYLDGGVEYIQIADNPSLHPDSFNSITVSGWVRDHDLSNPWDRIVTKGIHYTDTFQGWLLTLLDDYDGRTGAAFFIEIDGTQYSANQFDAKGTYSIRPNEWNYIVGTYDGSRIVLYVNGEAVAETRVDGTRITENGPVPFDVLIGNNYGWTEWMEGTIDEVRISSVPLGPDWIATEYNNQRDPQSFYRLGDEETIGDPDDPVESPEHTINLGEGLSLSLDTYLTQDPGDVRFFVMKNNPPTHRADKFGLAGVHGLWDTQKYHVDWFNEHYGVNKTGVEYLEKHFAMLKALGVKWIAMGIGWATMNKRDGVYVWDKFDIIFDMAEEYGLQIVTTLDGTPCWVNAIDDCTCGTNKCLCYQSNSGCDGMGLACTWRGKGTCCKPLDLSPSEGSPHFNDFVRRAVERYKPYGTRNPTSGYGIINWGIWNEPDWWFWKDCQKQTDASMEEYCQLFNGAAQAIKVTDPSANVLHGGVTGLLMSQLLGSIDDIETYCDADLYDLYNIHHYMHIDDMLSNLNQVLDSRDDPTKEVWITEFGWHDAGKLPEDEKREYMLKAMNDIDSLEWDGITKALWWDSRGYPSVPGDEWSTDAALMAGNYYPFPSYFTFGEWLGTIEKKGEATAVVKSQKVEANLPSSLFNEVGDYTVFYASESKMITALPIKVRVVTVHLPPPPEGSVIPALEDCTSPEECGDTIPGEPSPDDDTYDTHVEESKQSEGFLTRIINTIRSWFSN